MSYSQDGEPRESARRDLDISSLRLNFFSQACVYADSPGNATQAHSSTAVSEPCWLVLYLKLHSTNPTMMYTAEDAVVNSVAEQAGEHIGNELFGEVKSISQLALEQHPLSGDQCLSLMSQLKIPRARLVSQLGLTETMLRKALDADRKHPLYMTYLMQSLVCYRSLRGCSDKLYTALHSHRQKVPTDFPRGTTQGTSQDMSKKYLLKCQSLPDSGPQGMDKPLSLHDVNRMIRPPILPVALNLSVITTSGVRKELSLDVVDLMMLLYRDLLPRTVFDAGIDNSEKELIEVLVARAFEYFVRYPMSYPTFFVLLRSLRFTVNDLATADIGAMGKHLESTSHTKPVPAWLPLILPRLYAKGLGAEDRTW